MHITARSYLTAGVAMAGAGVIAVAPAITPTPMTVAVPPISTVAVDLSAAVNPITAWVNVFSGAAENVSGIATAMLQDPFPLLRQAMENAFGYGGTVVNAATGVIEGALDYFIFDQGDAGLWGQLRGAATQLFEGNISGAVTQLANALLAGPVVNLGFPVLTSGLLDIPAKIIENVLNVAKTVTSLQTLTPLMLGALSAVTGPLVAIGDSIQASFDALLEGNLIDAVVNLINIPAAATGAFLNGYTSELAPYPGLFTFKDNPFEAGLFQTLFVTIPKAIAAAIAPESVAGTAAADGPADTVVGEGTMVTLTEVSTTDATAETEPAATATEPAPTESQEAPTEVTETPGETTDTTTEEEAETPTDAVTPPADEDDAAPGLDEEGAAEEEAAEEGAAEEGAAEEEAAEEEAAEEEAAEEEAAEDAGAESGSGADDPSDTAGDNAGDTGGSESSDGGDSGDE